MCPRTVPPSRVAILEPNHTDSALFVRRGATHTQTMLTRSEHLIDLRRPFMDKWY